MSEEVRSNEAAPASEAIVGESAPVAQPFDAETSSAASEGLTAIFNILDWSAMQELIGAGGPVTIILLAMSVVTLTVILAKVWQFIRAGVGRRQACDEALALWAAGREAAALGRLNGRGGPSARVAAHAMSALAAGRSEPRVREDTERVALGELASLRGGLRVIETTVQTAPLLGLFGTVLGMIASFRALEGAGAQADPAVLAGGIWVALLTTAVGLAIAIPAALALTWFQGRIEREREGMEDAATSVFTRRLAEPAPRSEASMPGSAGRWHSDDEQDTAQRREAL